MVRGIRRTRYELSVKRCLLLLEDEGAHLGNHESLTLRLSNEILEKTLLNVHADALNTVKIN